MSEAIKKEASKEKRVNKALKAYRQAIVDLYEAHKVWMNTPVFGEAGRLAKERKDAAMWACEQARTEWVRAGGLD